MASLTYTALRELEKTGYLKTAVDISAAPADDSFNASSTNLSGLLTDQWVGVSGFVNASNNGTFQVQTNSTSGKIIQVTPPPNHLRLSGAANNYASTPDTAANSITGNIELMGVIKPANWGGTTQVIIAKDDGTTNRDYNLFLDSAAKPNFVYSTDGSTITGRTATATLAVPFAANVQGYVKATYNTGTGVVQFFTSVDGVVFTQLGTNVTITSGAIHNGSGVLTVGANGTGANPLNGRLFYAEVRTGIGGPVAAAFDATRGTRNSLTVGSLTSETWTINTSGTPPTLVQGLALVTEAAGPSVVLTGYKRGAGQQYSIDFGVEAAERSRKADRTIQTPINRSFPEVSYWGTDKILQVRTGKIDETMVGQWEEILASIEGGEFITFDRYGTIAAPVEPVQAMLNSEGHQWVREGSLYPSRYTLNFELLIF